MANVMAFDTLAYAKKLKAVGVPENVAEAQAEAQAEALAEIVEERLATKKDLKELEVSLKRDLKELEMRLTIRLGAVMAAGIGIFAALVKVF